MFLRLAYRIRHENGAFVPGLCANRKKLKTPVLRFNMLETKIFRNWTDVAGVLLKQILLHKSKKPKQMVVFHKSESAQTPNHGNFSTEVDVRSSQKPREKNTF